MGATTTEGTGPGDSRKRIAYLSSNLPKYKLTKTTTNDQDLITGEVESGGDDCGCDFDTEWELVYSAGEEEDGGPPAFAPLGATVNTGVLYDKMYTWAFGIKLITDSTLIPVTNPVLYSLVDLLSFPGYTAMEWSPDDNTNFQFKTDDNEFSILRPSLMPSTDFTVLLNSTASIVYEAATGEFKTYFSSPPSFGESPPVFGDPPPPGTVVYFVIARRRIVAL